MGGRGRTIGYMIACAARSFGAWPLLYHSAAAPPIIKSTGTDLSRYDII